MPDPERQRFVCVHGHFYQPPRENPWLEAVEVQDSAAPYHDWNERVTAECYAPNAAARLLDEQGYITALRNNYERISFNFGPTLLAWMERARPNVYAQVLLADHESLQRRGRGNALAQVYGHCIMPLASARDQQTQVRWGIADFVHRFGRRPEGMWLPETAVDRRTLATLAENGIRFTILAPSQAARVRYAGADWEDVRDGRIDCTRPYRCVVRSGVDVTVFFYDADIAHAVAFGGLLNDGRELAKRLTGAGAGNAGPHLVHVATDGESYGHHHRFGEMALAAAIEAIDREEQMELTNYAAYLDRVAVCDEVEIRENTSWSCAHGVERWRANCGCNSGAHPDWQQEWRAPLRQALDWLKTQLDGLFERHGAKVLRDPWAARDAYAAVLLQRNAEQRDAFLAAHALEHPQDVERVRIWKLLEMQRNALLSFTSCGWFFDEPSGIETVQVLAYAARAVQLAGECGTNLEPEFLRRLQPMRSNLNANEDGRQLYRRLVRPLLTDGGRVMAHYAMHSLFVAPAAETPLYAFRVTSLDRRAEAAGAASLAVGRARLLATVTDESRDYVYTALHLGGHDIHAAVSESSAPADDAQLQAALFGAFFAEPLTELVRRIDRAFGSTFYTLHDVFAAERRRIVADVTSKAMADCMTTYERIVADNRRLMDFLAQAHVPFPRALRVAARFVLQERLEQAAAHLADGAESTEASWAAWEDAKRWNVAPPLDGVQRWLEPALDACVAEISHGDADAGLTRAHAILDFARAVGLTLNTWETQNLYYVLVTTNGNRRWSRPQLAELRRLGERLSFHLREWDRLVVRAA